MSEFADRKLGKLRPMTRDSLALRVRDALKAYIVSENLTPGSQLPSERTLSESLAVSRNVIREGLSLLVAEGVIVKRAGSGIFLREIDPDVLTRDGGRVLDQERIRYGAVREARAAVELGAMGLIVNRITDRDLDELDRLTDLLARRLEQGGSFIKADMQFHLTLLRAARNEFLLQWSPLVEEVMRAWVYETESLANAIKSRPERGEADRIVAEHRAILDAIRRRDSGEARRLLKLHLLIADL